MDPLPHHIYSETCSCDHVYSETTCIQGPLRHVPIVALQCIFTSIKRPPLFKDHFFWAQAWLLNTGFTVLYALTVLCEFVVQFKVYIVVLEVDQLAKHCIFVATIGVGFLEVFLGMACYVPLYGCYCTYIIRNMSLFMWKSLGLVWALCEL